MVLSAYAWFSAAERVEQLAAEGYGLLAERFASEPAVAALFRRLRDEEIQHAARVRLLGAQYRNDAALFGAGALGRGAPDPRRLVAEAEQALREIEAGAWGRDLAVVRRRLIALEERCASVHAEVVAAAAAPEVAEFFAELARQDREHEALLAKL